MSQVLKSVFRSCMANSGRVRSMQLLMDPLKHINYQLLQNRNSGIKTNFNAFTRSIVVIEQSGTYERAFDIFSRLLRERIICINGPIDDNVAALTVAQLLFLEAEDPEKGISMYINSPGGQVTSGLSIYDTMQYVRCPISTLCVGQAASMGSLLLAAGGKGQRRSLPHARIMMHQPSGGYSGTAADIKIHSEEMERVQRTLYQLYASHTGQTWDTIAEKLDRDHFMTPEMAKDFGLLDEVILKRTETLQNDE